MPDGNAPTKKRCGTAPCKGCPLLRANQGKRTKGGFYTTKNLRRLWSGIRSGEILICHSTDPNAHETGSPAEPKPGQIKPGGERVCLGQLILYRREEALLNELGDYKAFKADPRSVKPPMKPEGFLAVVNAVMFAGTPLAGVGPIEFLEPDMEADVGLPWEDK